MYVLADCIVSVLGHLKHEVAQGKRDALLRNVFVVLLLLFRVDSDAPASGKSLGKITTNILCIYTQHWKKTDLKTVSGCVNLEMSSTLK